VIGGSQWVRAHASARAGVWQEKMRGAGRWPWSPGTAGGRAVAGARRRGMEAGMTGHMCGGNPGFGLELGLG